MKKYGLIILMMLFLSSCNGNEYNELSNSLQEVTSNNELLNLEIETIKAELDSLISEKKEVEDKNQSLMEENSMMIAKHIELEEDLEFITEMYKRASVALQKTLLDSSEFAENDRYKKVMPYLEDGRTYIAQSLSTGSKIRNLTIEEVDATDYSITLSLKGEFDFKGYVYWDDIISESLIINGCLEDDSEDIESVVFFGYDMEYNILYYLLVGHLFTIENSEQFYNIIGQDYADELRNGEVFYVEASFENCYTYKKIESETISNAQVTKIDIIEKVDRSILSQMN